MIDTSPPGSWRHALAPEAPSCRVCGQNECDHSDNEYVGIVPDLQLLGEAGNTFHGEGNTCA